jgi:hypothetical protein
MPQHRARRLAAAAGVAIALVATPAGAAGLAGWLPDWKLPDWKLPDWKLPGEFSGLIAADTRIFLQDPQFTHQRDQPDAISLLAEPEWYLDWNDGSDAVLFVPFARVNPLESERSHFDIRELNYLHVGNDWEVRIGFAKVFWGVIESQHLVDIINQDDALENLDGEDKLGQPMIHASLIRDWGVLEGFVLPGFREREFPHKHARLRAPLLIDRSDPVYESSMKQGHVDLAARWTQTFGNWDVGLSNFWGTSRDPLLLFDPATTRLVPRYDIINQTGLELQYTGDALLLKLEAIGRSGQGSYRPAFAVGFEYTFVGIAGTDTDLGLLAEYHFDDASVDQPFSPFDRDVFAGFRLTLNDTQSTQMLAGAVVDVRTGTTFWNVEASRRLYGNWVLEFEMRLFTFLDDFDPMAPLTQQDAFSSFAQDDYIQFRLAWYF